MNGFNKSITNSRVIIIQKLYGKHFNKDEIISLENSQQKDIKIIVEEKPTEDPIVLIHTTHDDGC